MVKARRGINFANAGAPYRQGPTERRGEPECYQRLNSDAIPFQQIGMGLARARNMAR
jgi:hypothetical protein